jgi:hypothetical protein
LFQHRINTQRFTAERQPNGSSGPAIEEDDVNYTVKQVTGAFVVTRGTAEARFIHFAVGGSPSSTTLDDTVPVGTTHCFLCGSSHGITISADAGATIIDELARSSITGGNVSTTHVGDYVELTLIGGKTWSAKTHTWAVDGVFPPSGGGDSWTATTWTGNLGSGIANGDAITHPSVAIDDEENIFVIAKQMTSDTAYEAYDIVESKNTTVYWTYDDLNTNSASWHDEGAGIGHFSAAAGADVQVGCWCRINGVTRQIIDLTGDGTGAGAVELDGDPGDDYAITWIHAGSMSNGIDCGKAVSGPSPAGVWYTAAMTSSCEYLASLREMASYIKNLSGGTYHYGTARVKAAFSKDGGTTWYYHNGTNWVTMTKSEFSTKGNEYSFSNYRWEASDGTEMTESLYEDFGDIQGLRLRVMFAFYCNADTDYVHVQDQDLSVYLKSVWKQLPSPGMSGTVGVDCYRASDTKMVIANGGWSSLLDLHVTVYTK